MINDILTISQTTATGGADGADAHQRAAGRVQQDSFADRLDMFDSGAVCGLKRQ